MRPQAGIWKILKLAEWVLEVEKAGEANADLSRL